jgi:hypothetical protein
MARKKSATPEVTPAPESPVTPAPTPTLTAEQIALGATNDPALSKDSFTLCGKTYKYVHLSYDYYIEFMLKIKPLLAAVVGTVTAKAKATVNLPGIELSESPLSGVMQFCGSDVPDMVRIIVNNSLEADGRDAERITVADIKKFRGITPMQLSEIIMGQVLYNNMISEFASFFVQMMPLLTQMGILTKPQAK